jgi:ABC-type dipeptide/oligopeptide/nickel transport system permease component
MNRSKEPLSLGAWLFIIIWGVPLGIYAAIYIGIPILLTLVVVIMYQPFLSAAVVILLMVIGFFLGLAERKIRAAAKAKAERKTD